MRDFFAVFSLRASKLPELRDFHFQIYLIKATFFGSFKFVFCQFWCLLRNNCILYLIWKLSLVVLNSQEAYQSASHWNLRKFYSLLKVCTIQKLNLNILIESASFGEELIFMEFDCMHICRMKTAKEQKCLGPTLRSWKYT